MLKATNHESGWVIGVDEAGRGPAMGPLVVAALAVRDQQFLKDRGVRDSKHITPARRSAMYRDLESSPDVIFKCSIVGASDLDSLMAEASLNIVETRLFAAAISQLVTALPAGTAVRGIYLDACDVKEERFGNRVMEIVRRKEDTKTLLTGESTSVFSRHRADSLYPVVSAASIVAKVTRDREMDAIRQISRSMEEMGSGYPSDRRTTMFLENWIKENGVAPAHARRSWKTVQKLEAKYANAQKQLSDF